MVIIFQMNVFFEFLGFVVRVYSVVLEEQSDSRSNGLGRRSVPFT